MMGSEGDARANAWQSVASLAIGPKNAAPPRKGQGERAAGTQTTQASGTSTKLRKQTMAVGSANVIYDFEGDGFWMAIDEGPSIAPEPCQC